MIKDKIINMFIERKERRRVHAIAEGIKPIYKTKKIELETGCWEIYTICNGCAKKDFLSTKTATNREIFLKVSENGNDFKYCSLCAVEALSEINKEVKKIITTNPELDHEAINKMIEQRKKQTQEGN